MHPSKMLIAMLPMENLYILVFHVSITHRAVPMMKVNRLAALPTPSLAFHCPVVAIMVAISANYHDNQALTIANQHNIYPAANKRLKLPPHYRGL